MAGRHYSVCSVGSAPVRGARGDALEHHQRFRTRLVEEIGVEPGAALQDVRQRILAAEPVCERQWIWCVPGRQRASCRAPGSFIGRAGELDCLDAWSLCRRRHDRQPQFLPGAPQWMSRVFLAPRRTAIPVAALSSHALAH
ncbi:BTAD domain-containing putative transcriptional regulator [Amycolatopsis sp. NPDC024027]|uniref:BTAD domain-containing putative transcriptional regulator n=1 Tax=Amycolatopsis sp. NPDC024027 TaxID=3154327 RepID=UPI0033FE8C56